MLRGKIPHFRLTCVAQKRCCLSSLLSLIGIDLRSGSRPSDKGGTVIRTVRLRGRGGSQKFFFSALRASVWSENKGGRLPRTLPWIHHCILTYVHAKPVEFSDRLKHFIGRLVYTGPFKIFALFTRNFERSRVTFQLTKC